MRCTTHLRDYDEGDCCPVCADVEDWPGEWRHTLVVDLATHTLTWHLDRFRHLLAAEIARLKDEDGLTLRPEVVAQVMTTLDVLSTATHAQLH